MAASFERRPWLLSLIPAAAAAVALLAWSPVRGQRLGLVTLLLFRFVSAPYMLRLNECAGTGELWLYQLRIPRLTYSSRSCGSTARPTGLDRRECLTSGSPYARFATVESVGRTDDRVRIPLRVPDFEGVVAPDRDHRLPWPQQPGALAE